MASFDDSLEQKSLSQNEVTFDTDLKAWTFE